MDRLLWIGMLISVLSACVEDRTWIVVEELPIIEVRINCSSYPCMTTLTTPKWTKTVYHAVDYTPTSTVKVVQDSFLRSLEFCVDSKCYKSPNQ